MKPRTKEILSHASAFFTGATAGAVVTYTLCRRAMKSIFWVKNRLVWLIFLLPALGTSAQKTPDITTWDINPGVITSQEYIYFMRYDPTGPGEAVVVFVTGRNWRGHNRFVGASIRVGRVCYKMSPKTVGRRNVLSVEVAACKTFDELKRLYLRVLGQKQGPPYALEEIRNA